MNFKGVYSSLVSPVHVSKKLRGWLVVDIADVITSFSRHSRCVKWDINLYLLTYLLNLSLGVKTGQNVASWRLTVCSETPARPPTNTWRLSTSAGQVRTDRHTCIEVLQGRYMNVAWLSNLSMCVCRRFAFAWRLFVAGSKHVKVFCVVFFAWDLSCLAVIVFQRLLGCVPDNIWSTGDEILSSIPTMFVGFAAHIVRPSFTDN